MKYTVVNAPVADEQLADIWVKSKHRQDVADAFNAIESSLKQDAPFKGREHQTVGEY